MAGGGGANNSQGPQLGGFLSQQNPAGGFNTQSPYNNYAAPTQGQGQNPFPFPQITPVQNTGGPDVTGNAPAAQMGFDNSGSDAGVGGQPTGGMQSPIPQGNKPLNLSQFQAPQGFQIQGNPTSSLVQPKPQQR